MPREPQMQSPLFVALSINAVIFTILKILLLSNFS